MTNRAMVIGATVAMLAASTARADLRITAAALERGPHAQLPVLRWNVTNDGGRECRMMTSIQVIGSSGRVLDAPAWREATLASGESRFWTADLAGLAALQDVRDAAWLQVNVWVRAGSREYVVSHQTLNRVRGARAVEFETRDGAGRPESQLAGRVRIEPGAGDALATGD